MGSQEEKAGAEIWDNNWQGGFGLVGCGGKSLGFTRDEMGRFQC